ncbi:hypothetical protein BJY52DRAFT_1225626 [Lactarius psammicola]|nr:hypothetical protein BJY52DRAFT_1225626 [Lactarius psammicola]
MLHEQGPHVWKCHPASQQSRVRSGIGGLRTKLMGVSTPSSPQYSQWLSKEEVGTFVTPKPETTTAVNEWLSANGLKAKVLLSFGDWIYFYDRISWKSAIRTPAYSIPASVQGPPPTRPPYNCRRKTFWRRCGFPSPSGIGPRIFSSLAKIVPAENLTPADQPLSCHSFMTPSYLQQLYDIPREHALQSSNMPAVPGFLQQFAYTIDPSVCAKAGNSVPKIKRVSSQFLRIFRLDLSPHTTHTLQKVTGGRNSRTPSSLRVDVEALAISSRTATFIDFLRGKSAPPQVFTTTYGQDENTISRINLCNLRVSRRADCQHPLRIWWRWRFGFTKHRMHDLRAHFPVRSPIVSSHPRAPPTAVSPLPLTLTSSRTNQHNFGWGDTTSSTKPPPPSRPAVSRTTGNNLGSNAGGFPEKLDGILCATGLVTQNWVNVLAAVRLCYDIRANRNVIKQGQTPILNLCSELISFYNGHRKPTMQRLCPDWG